MLQFIKKAGRKRHITKSPSLNIERNDVTDGISANNFTQGGNKNDQQLLNTIEQQIFNDQSENYIDEIVSHSTKRIIRIVSDRNCLCYFVQYLEQKSALPLIRFWLDVESFKSSAEQCGHHQHHHHHHSKVVFKRAAHKPSIGRSISLDGMALNRDDFYNAYHHHQPHHDDDISPETVGKSIDPNNLSSSNELPPERDNGDGSSDANSMTNLSDIFERNDDDQLETISMDDEYGGAGGGGAGGSGGGVSGTPKVFENGRKSATGASSHDGGADDSEYDTKSWTQSKLATSMTIDAIRMFRKYLLAGELTQLVHIPTAILSQISLVLCVRPNDDNTDHQIDGQPTSSTPTNSKLSISNESLALSTNGGCVAVEENTLITVFDDAQSYILDHLDQMYCAEFLESPFYYRFCLENTGTNLFITDILYNELALFYFMEFLEIEQKREYLDFWLAAMNFKRQLIAPVLPPPHMMDDKGLLTADDADATTTTITTAATNDCNTIEQCQNDALILYEKYFSLQATCPLHLSDRIRFHVEEKICTIDDTVDVIAHCFDLPLAVIERFLSVRYLQPFERSALFYKYLTELRQKMHAMSTKSTTNPAAITISTPSGVQYTATTGSNEMQPHNNKRSAQNRPISTRNTLLAMESVKKRTHSQKNLKSSDMCIDARQLHDPDLLWRRTTTPGGLKFGRVNALGRYERDYDMTPCDKSSATAAYMRLGGGGGGGNVTMANTGPMDTNQILQSTSNKIKRAVRKLVHLPEQCMQEELAWQMAEMIVKDITSVTLQTNQVPRDENV